jgi:hypothetical protein
MFPCSVSHLLAAEEVGMDHRTSRSIRNRPIGGRHCCVSIPAWRRHRLGGGENAVHALRRSIEPASCRRSRTSRGELGPLQRETAVVLFGVPTTWRPAELKDMADTAALISQLDLVLTIDTSYASCRSLGQVWIMLTHSPDWRWLEAR